MDRRLDSDGACGGRCAAGRSQTGECFQEFQVAQQTFRLTLDDFEKITINAMKSAFIGYRERCAFIFDVIKPGYAKARV